jgi:glycosyltransferase involved in cell wall biosynthesis
MKQILFLTHAHPQGYRIQHYFPFLEARGFRVELVTSREGFLSLIDKARKADLVYIQRLLFGPLKLKLFRAAAKRIIYDFDDAVMYGTKGESTARRVKFRGMVQSADAVLAGSRFLVKEAETYRDEGVHYVPTVVMAGEYAVKRHPEQDTCLLGWIGSSSTLKYLSDIEEPLREVLKGGNVRAKVIADKPPEMKMEGLLFEPWRKDKEMAALLSLDVGLMPVRDDIWSRGKCGLKLVQYMAAGLPSVTHPVGVANEMIEEGVNGFLRADSAGWQEALEELSRNRQLRERMGRAAREIVEDRYSLEVWGPRVAEIIDGIVSSQ